MRLTPEQLDRLRQHLQTNFRGGCTVCGNPHWQFDDVIFELRQFAGGGFAADALIKPAIAVTCTNCGHIVMLNAIATGVIRIEQSAGAEPINQETFTETEETLVEDDDDEVI